MVQEWNEGALDKLVARLSTNVIFEAPVRKNGLPGGTLLTGADQFRAVYPQLKGALRSFELVSVLGDEASASLVLRDNEGDLLTVLLAFDGEHRLRRVTSYRRLSTARKEARR